MDRSTSVVAYVALGSNVGDRRALLRQAVRHLTQQRGIRVARASSLYETSPVDGPPDQDRYFNAVLAMQSSLPAGALLKVAHRVEAAMGRMRDVANGPRTIDIDLLLFGDEISERTCCRIPHPRLHQRRFVLEPLAEVAADVIHSVLRRSARQLLSALSTSSCNTERVVRVADPSWCAEALPKPIPPC